MGMIFQKTELREVSLPIPATDQNYNILRKGGLEILQAVAYGDGYMVAEPHICNFLTEDVAYSLGNSLVRTFNEQYIKGYFFLNGKILFKGNHLLVGVFSFDANKNGFIWGHDFRNRGLAL
jgi:hypothetical protein